MANNILGDGELVNLTAGASVDSGTLAVLPGSQRPALSIAAADSGAAMAVATRGHIRYAKVSAAIADTVHTAAESFAVGDNVYLDATADRATRKAMGPLLGWATKNAASGDAYVEINIVDPKPASQIDIVAILDASLNSSIGTHTLPGGTIPHGYVVKGYTYEPLVTFTSASDAATIALGVETQDDDCLKTATAISSGTTWDAVSPATPVQASAAAVIRTTAARKLTAKIAVEELTAGRMAVIAHCVYHGVVA